MATFFRRHQFLFPILLCVLATVVFFSLFDVALAQNNLNAAVNQQIQSGAAGAEFGEAVDPRLVIAGLIRLLLTFVGTFFLALILLSGYWWMTDRGEGEKMAKAQKTLTRAVTGLIVVLLAYAITIFVTNIFVTSIYGENYRQQTRERTFCIVGGPECFFQGGL